MPDSSCYQAVNCADNAVGSARGNVRTREERLNNKKQELRDLEEELSAKKRQREDKQRELERQQKDLKEKKETQKQVLNLSEKLKYFATFIATTLGRTKVSIIQLLLHIVVYLRKWKN